MKHKTTIALDFDQTYTAHPRLWRTFVESCIEEGITIKFVTYRDHRAGNVDIEGVAEILGIDIVYCNGKQKQHICYADMWIDDNPILILDFKALGSQYDMCLAIGDMGEEESK